MWVGRFADACQRAVRDAASFEKRIQQIQSEWRIRLGRVRGNSAADLLITSIAGAPVLTTAAGVSCSAWIAQTARKEFIIRAGLEAVSQYEAEHGPFTPAEIARADEWAARVTQPSGARRTA